MGELYYFDQHALVIILTSPDNKTYDDRMQKIKQLSNKKILALCVFAIVIFYIAALFTPVIKPYAQFPLYIIKCAGLPIEASEFGNSYTTPQGRNYSVNIFTNRYFCTEDEAKASGFKRAEYNR